MSEPVEEMVFCDLCDKPYPPDEISGGHDVETEGGLRAVPAICDDCADKDTWS